MPYAQMNWKYGNKIVPSLGKESELDSKNSNKSLSQKLFEKHWNRYYRTQIFKSFPDQHAPSPRDDRVPIPRDDRAPSLRDDRAPACVMSVPPARTMTVPPAPAMTVPTSPRDDRAASPHDDRAPSPRDDRAPSSRDKRASSPCDDRAPSVRDDRAPSPRDDSFRSPFTVPARWKHLFKFWHPAFSSRKFLDAPQSLHETEENIESAWIWWNLFEYDEMVHGVKYVC